MHFPDLTGANTLLACTAFAIGVASPGPSVLAVMGTAMAQGRARTLALAAGARQGDALAFVVSCALISATVFSCYALAFSTGAARRAYRAGERWVNAVLAGVFAYAGVRMLLAR